MQEEFKGEIIKYDEPRNKWVWDNNEYTSLSGAKEAIARYHAKEKKFKRIEAYCRDYRGDYEKLTVTSIAEGKAWDGGDICWVSRGGRRAKEGAKCLFAVSEENTKKIEEIGALKNKIRLLDAQIDAIHKTLAPAISPEKAA